MSVMTLCSDYSDDWNLPVARIAEFCRYLRENGMRTTTRDAELFIEVLDLIENGADAGRVEQLWRPIACSSLKDWKIWSELFRLFWFPHRVKGTVKVTGTTRRSRQLRRVLVQRLLSETPRRPLIKINHKTPFKNQRAAPVWSIHLVEIFNLSGYRLI